MSHHDDVLLLCRPDGTTATSSRDKASLFAELFANKMKVDDPGQPPPQLALQTHRTVTTVSVITEQVEWLLSAMNVTKATGSNDVLKWCAEELSGPLSIIFTSCLRENKWPSQWKEARVSPVHKN